MLEEKVKDFINELFDGWVSLACDDSDEAEEYENDPDEYATARMQEVADDLDDWFDNEFELYHDGEFTGYDIQDVKAEFKKQLNKLGY